MNRRLIPALMLLFALPATAQVAREITFFSNPGMSGARFTVSGSRTSLDLAFLPRSAIVLGSGRWELCSSASYAGKCTVVTANQSSLSLGQIRSVRLLDATVPGPGTWREIARLTARDHADRDLVPSSDRTTLFRDVKVCSEKNTVRVRRAEVQLGNGTWQRLFIPLVLEQGQCSKAIDLMGDARKIRAVRFEYEAWTAGWEAGTISVMALPHAQVQPR